jgi:hypothetical protein
MHIITHLYNVTVKDALDLHCYNLIFLSNPPNISPALSKVADILIMFSV